MTSNVALTGLAKDLYNRETTGNPIRIGLVGCGEMGTDLLARIALMDGIEIIHIVTRTIEKVYRAVEIAFGTQDKVKECNTQSEIYSTIELKKIAASNDLKLLLENQMVDVIVDSTGDPNAGAEIGYQALQYGKHIVSMNVEADVTIGAYLSIEAKKKNLVYSLGAGDEPTACMEIINFISALGHKVVCAGKGKNNPLIFDATPDQYIEEATKRDMNPRMLVEFIDGSKTMVEMAAIANATGLNIDIAGMHGANASLGELEKTFIPATDGGILKTYGVVDYTIGKDVAPGVFAIAEMREPRIHERMRDLKLGEGPYYCFYRPYHLTAMEVPLSCAKAVLYNTYDMQPLPKMTAEVCAVAKKDLKTSDTLDFIGLYTYRAFTMDASEALQANAIPCGLLKNAKVTKPIAKGALITYDNCSINEDLFIAKLRKQQDIILNK